MIIRPTMKFVAFRELIKADKINVFYNSDTVRYYYSRNGPLPFFIHIVENVVTVATLGQLQTRRIFQCISQYMYCYMIIIAMCYLLCTVIYLTP